MMNGCGNEKEIQVVLENMAFVNFYKVEMEDIHL